MVKQGRRALDAYMTPGALAKAICERVAKTVLLPTNPAILEPGAGTGAFVLAARDTWGDSARIAALDIDTQYRRYCLAAGANTFVTGDYVKEHLIEAPFALVIGNPPYNLAEQFVERACVDGISVCFLMRAAFRSGVKRWTKGGVFSRHPPSVTWPVVPRPSFTGGGTEHMEYEAFLWTKQVVMTTNVQPIVWRGA